MIHVEQVLHGIALIVLLVVIGELVGTWLSPLVLAANREPIADDRILDPVLLGWASVLGVRFYVAPTLERGDLAFSCFLGFHRAIVVSAPFFRHAPDPVVRFVLAHELAHHTFGHVWRRMLFAALRLRRWPLLGAYAARQIQRDEDEANAYAEQVTDLPRSIVWAVGPNVVSARGGSAQSSEERPA